MINLLWSSEERYRVTFNQAAIGIAHIAANGSFLNVNNKFCDIVGYSKADLLGKTFQDITHPDYLSKDLELMKDLVDGKIDNYTIEKKYLNSAGGEIWVQLTVTLVKKPTGDLDYFISIVNDITSRKAIEYKMSMILENLEQMVEEKVQEQRALQQEFTQFFNLSSNLMVVGDNQGRIKRVNQAMIDLLGYSQTELLNMKVMDIIHPEDRGKSIEFREQMTKFGGVAKFFENRYICKNGEIKSISWNVTVIKGTGARYAIGQDITEQKNLQKQMEEKKIKMASLARLNAVGRMAANIAHEINNPLTVIYGKSSWLRLYASDKEFIASEKVLGVCEEIELMSKRMTSIIRGLRSFAREETGAAMQSVKIKAIIDSTLALCRHQFKLHEIKCIVEGNAIESNIFCREIQISQVLLNLLNNAFDALQDRENKEIKISVEKSADQLFIRVTDNGMGIPQEHIPNLFEPFFTTKDMGKGSGLGLNISQQIIVDHGGHISCEMREGLTTFLIQLPLKEFSQEVRKEPAVGL